MFLRRTMEHFPIFMHVSQRKILIEGSGEAAISKLRLLRKTSGRIQVFSQAPSPALVHMMQEHGFQHFLRPLTQDDFADALLAYAATENHDRDKEIARLANHARVPVNVVDNLELSGFITPAIVDRDPVTVAIGTEGTAPILARHIKAQLEESLSPTLGPLARLAQGFRHAAEAIPFGRARRNFWRDFFFHAGPRRLPNEGQEALHDILKTHLNTNAPTGYVSFVGAGPGDPELLTLKARKALDRADVVIHDRLVTPEILELARREAILIDVGKTGFGPSTPQDQINALNVEHALQGAHVVRLKGGDCTVFGRLDEEIDALEAHAIPYHIVPGITAASASIATIGQSLTKRGRNTSVKLMTGYDMKGYADQDWRTLAQEGEVAAIYMGAKSARYIQGRLLMNGANPAMPITLVENASRADQNIFATTLADLPATLDSQTSGGAVLTLLGIAPRHSADLYQTLDTKEYA